LWFRRGTNETAQVYLRANLKFKKQVSPRQYHSSTNGVAIVRPTGFWLRGKLADNAELRNEKGPISDAPVDSHRSRMFG